MRAAQPTPAADAPAALFTSAQADRGQQLFRSVCSSCHYTNEFSGEDFRYAWRRQNADDLFEYMADAMPEDAPGSLSSQQYLDVLAYMLELNGLPAGGSELSRGALAGISLAQLSGS